MFRENLILIHSFPTNSLLLAGLTEYLSDYFEVYWIDLPGFTQAVPALADISLEGYAKFVEKEIETLELGHYWLAGISFGFAVINRVEPGAGCRGFIAMEPYLGVPSMKMGCLKRSCYSLFCRGVTHCGLSSWLWSHGLFKRWLVKMRQHPAGQLELVFEQMDGRTFFETAGLIFNTWDQGDFKPLPYILVANPADQTLDYDYIFRTFTEKVEQLLVVHTPIGHYPQDLSKAYFQAQIPEAVVKEGLAFMMNPPPAIVWTLWVPTNHPVEVA